MSYKVVNSDISGSVGGATTFLDTVTLEPTIDIAAPSGEDIQVRLGDAAGANKFTLLDSALVAVIQADSDGTIQILDASNNGNPQIRMGATDAEEVHFQSIYDSGAQTLDYVLFQTDAVSATANKGLFRFNVDGSDILDIDDGGIDLDTGGALSINGTDVLSATVLGSGVLASSLTSVGILASLALGGAISGATTLGMAGDLTDYEAVNDGSPSIFLGSSSLERLNIQAVYNSGAQTIARIDFITSTASGTGDDGQFRFTVDDVAILDIDDGGIEVTGGGSFTAGLSGITTLATSGVYTASGAINVTIADTVNDVPLEVVQNDTTNNPVAASVANTGTGNTLFLNSDGNSVSLNVDSEATTADVLSLDGNPLTTGNLLLATNTLSGTALANRSAGNNLVDVTVSRTDARTSGTTADDYDVVNITRTSVTTGSGGTMTSAGSVLRLANTVTQTDGTLTDTVNVLEIEADTDSTGYAILIGNE